MIRRYVFRNPRNNRDRYLNDLSLALDQQIKINTVNGRTKVGVVTVGSTPQLVKIDSEPLSERHLVKILNDSSFLIYYGFSDNMQPGVDAVLINSGSAVSLNIDPNSDTDIWVVSPDLPVEIKIVEVAT